MNRVTKKRKFTKRKAIVIIVLIAILLGIATGIFFLINRFIPVKDITKDDITINLSTIKPTGKSITAEVSTKTNYDIYYFIDYAFAEEKYYENEEFSEEVEEISDDSELTNNASTSKETTSKPEINIKQVSDNEYKKVEKAKFEIENNGVVYLKYGRLGKLSSTPYVFEITNIDKTGPEIGEIETTSTYTSITVKVNAIDNNNGDLQYSFKLAETGNYISTGTKNTYTFTELTTDESYIIYVKVTDSFGNEAEAVTEATASVDQEVVEKKVYHIKVNTAANTVTVYDKDANGKYTQAIKAFVCSTGKSTPKSGTYKISDRYRWRSLFGGVYGQYAVRIYGNILFHSVPYEQMYANTLEYEEYDKLGTSASMGCVRLCVRDAKWIYDNAKTGTTVEFYQDASNPGPLGKPTSQKISSNKANRNWDPTDPDKHNPWLGGDGAVTKVTIINEDTSSTKIKNTTTNTNTTISNNTTNTTNTTNTISNNTANNTIIWNTQD
ncbi:MAG: L,D-transpeptidase [Clostridia bacterium]|nr:L,D-transpeptidase [Clostridia bacterium]